MNLRNCRLWSICVALALILGVFAKARMRTCVVQSRKVDGCLSDSLGFPVRFYYDFIKYGFINDVYKLINMDLFYYYHISMIIVTHTSFATYQSFTLSDAPSSWCRCLCTSHDLIDTRCVLGSNAVIRVLVVTRLSLYLSSYFLLDYHLWKPMDLVP